MWKLTRLPSIAVLALVVACTSTRVEPRPQVQAVPLQPKPGTAAERWLATDCQTGQREELVKALLADPDDSRELFLKVLEPGPDRTRAEGFRRTAERRYQRRARILERLPEADRAAAEAVTLEQYTAEAVTRSELGYKSKAMTGLAVVKGPGAEERLREISEDEDADPLLLHVARLALTHFE